MSALDDALAATLGAAGANRGALERALADTEHPAWMRFLLAWMPAADAKSLSADHLLENVAYAARVRREVPVSMPIPEDVFLEHVLPYACMDERRDRWRPVFYEQFAETARRSASIEDAVRSLNRLVFEWLGVTFHATKRSHDNMSPFESAEGSYASCTGLSILLACACRAVGIPARLAGTPAWTDGSGNHTWVEIYDHGTWHFLGASEPGPYDLTWFNDKARAVAASRDHGLYATRWSRADTHFPLFWNGAATTVPAEERSAFYAAIAETPEHPTRISTSPRRYVCPKVERPLAITGRMDDPQWQAVPWTTAFVDIEGHKKPTPRFCTRAKMCWDDTYFYVAAYLDDPHVVATLTEKNSIIFNDPDFEIFIDPDGDNHDYYEFEINALGTIWELHLERPYRDGGPIHRGKNIEGLVSAVHVDGTLNDPTDQDRGWSVEVAIPWKGLAAFAGGKACPPNATDVWRVNFSRVHWLFDIVDGGYRKVPREAHPEDNWVWSPQDAIDMHRPEKFGYVHFSDQPPGAQPAKAPRDPLHAAREWLMDLYYLQQGGGVPSHDPADCRFAGVPPPELGTLRIEARADGWVALLETTLTDGTLVAISVDHKGRLVEA